MSRPVQMTLRDFLDLKARTAGLPTQQQLRDQPRLPKGRSKYGNRRVTEGNLTFDSKAEHRRWHQLLVLQRACEITELQRQVRYELIPATVGPDGKKHRATAYVADFVYRTKDGKVVVEDVKGVVTPEFKLKRKLMLERHGIEVQEVRS